MLIKFSAKRVPSIGDEFASKLHYFPSSGAPIPAGTTLVVTGFDVEYGWLFVRAAVKGSTDGRIAYVAGCDVPAWEPEQVAP